MNQREHQRRALFRAIVSICDFQDSIAAEAEGERAHAACMAARSCLLAAASIADVDAAGVVDILDADTLSDRARALLDDAAGRDRKRRRELADEVVMLARQLVAHPWDEWAVSDEVKQDARELSVAVWLYDEELSRSDGS